MMQYIDQNTTPRTNIKRQDDPTTLERENDQLQSICRSQSQLKGFRVRLDLAEKDFIEPDQ